MIKALFFDIDGTLVSFNTHRIPPSAIEAVEQAKKQGIRIYISTGRPYPLIDNIGEISHLVDGYITANGAYCFVGNREVLCRPVPAPHVRTLLKKADEMGFATMIVGEKDLAMHHDNEQARRIFRDLLNVAQTNTGIDTESLLQQRILQLTPVITEAEENQIMPLMPDCLCTRWHPDFADITAAGANKGSGLLAIAASEQLRPEETAAFGDGGNDLSILQTAGLGIAMGNATDNLKAAADHITATVDEDGIYHALHKWIL